MFANPFAETSFADVSIVDWFTAVGCPSFRPSLLSQSADSLAVPPSA